MRPQQIVFEIVPFELIEDFPRLLAALEPIKQLGCQFALDSFGIGYSGMAYLRNLPLHYVKAGCDLFGNADEDALLSAIGGLTKALSLQFVVTGIESEDQLSAALAGGAGLVEGFYLSNPSPELPVTPHASTLFGPDGASP